MVKTKADGNGGKSRTHKLWVAGGALALVALVVIGVWGYVRQSDTPRTADDNETAGQEQNSEEVIARSFQQERSDNLNQEAADKLTAVESMDDGAQKASEQLDVAEIYFSLSEYEQARAQLASAEEQIGKVPEGKQKTQLTERLGQIRTAIESEEAFLKHFEEGAD